MQKILYVEDDLSLIDGLQYTLEASGYMVDNAKTVKEALALFRKNTYDLLLLDVTLPDGTGFDVCKAVRNSSTVPIIFLTASDQEINIVRGLDMGADDYITKPFKLNELLSRIKAILRRSLQFSKADTFLEARKKKDLTQQELADLSHVSVKQIANIEKGKMNPSYLILRALAKVLHISLDTLINPDISLEDEGVNQMKMLYSSCPPEMRDTLLHHTQETVKELTELSEIFEMN
jgi:DNA-binding response OmpR family regulator